MKRFDSPLNSVKIASPCDSNWEEMHGDEIRRFCSACGLNVYNLSGMTRDEAEGLIANTEGRLCVRLFRRSDGTVITRDCPVGYAKLKKLTRRLAIAVGSLIITFFTGIFFVTLFSKKKPHLADIIKQITVSDPEPLMGAVAYFPDESKSGPNIQPSKFEVGRMIVLKDEKEIRR